MKNLNWQTIRAWNGSQPGGFEELCVQLARSKTPEGANFVALGSPDAGVECYCVFDDNTEWGWQAKYFIASLTNVQWKQIDESVEKALDKHPALVRYFICIAHDRPDPRKPNQKWEMDRWNAHVSKWEGWAQVRGMDVEFVWWGSSELLERLSQNEHIGRRFFWFGQRGFDQDWFRYHLDEAVGAAGPRYTPEVHIDLPIAQDIERFSRSSFLFNEVKSLAIGIRGAHTSLMSAGKSLGQPVQGIDIDELSRTTGVVLRALAQIEPSPIGPLPFAEIAEAADKAEELSARLADQIRKLRREHEVKSQGSRTLQGHSRNPFEDLLYYLQRLQWELREAVETCNHAGAFASGRLLLLKGGAGTGKTHLLCDFAKKRIEAKLPTVILMGQRFLNKDDPWIQLLHQLDLSGTSAEEFVGALEAAAQASDCRALVMIDALNEGNGKEIWPAHLSSFLSRLEESPWIGVVLSFRSSYEEVVVPGNVRDKAAVVTHYGFDDHEYDAVQTFFSNYGLEFPSVPILQPEFRNPLFLKTICKGLSDKGERRIPRGFHGITAAFSLYLETVSDRLAADLDYNPKDNLVRGALDSLCKLLVETESRWLPRPRAEQAVNELLPGRGFSNSLYRGLVTEGVLIEDRGWWIGVPSEEVVFISYDRFADHIIADFLLRTHLNIADPEAAFADGGSLVFLTDGRTYVHQGLIEALCIQVPECTGHELVRLAPRVQDSLAIGDAFLESIVWRKLDAFSDDTLAVFDELMEGKRIKRDALDALLTVSTVPGHPLNADFLDRRLREDIMPDRDAWWSIYLHRARGSQGPVDRLVDWASSLSVADDVEDAVVDLSATTLAWMFTTPNRFLRDRATKALVSLLTGRPESTMRLVDRFADVDDLYVLERVYAVAYGTAMRSHDVTAVGKLALLVYEHVFATGTPPAHILLRDYARGVVERAFYLDPNLPVNQLLIQPPYTSVWPSIPCEDCVEALTPNREKGAWVGGDLEWSRNRIRWSVLSDDFAHYVIGADSSSNWMSLRLEEESWQTPAERKQALLLELNESESLAWDEFQKAKAEMPPIVHPLIIKVVNTEGNSDDGKDLRIAPIDEETYEQACLKLELLHDQLMAKLTEGHRTVLESILHDENEREGREGPRFDKRLIQRYILWRAFDLGWTKERFGSFDRFDIGYAGRSAYKAERIGKKYQWIAYHEILAYTADHYQYRERYGGGYAPRRYEGPWQEYLRDIDPACTLKSIPGGTSWGPHNPTWWGKELYGAWHEKIDHKDWLADCDDIPDIAQLLQVVNPDDGTHWLNVNGSFVWRQPHPAHETPYDHNRREVGVGLTAYFVQAEAADAFISWAKSVDFWGRWMPEPPSLSSVYLGEYGWSPSFEHLCSDASDFEDWIKPEARDGGECPASIQCASFRYLAENGGFDCSVEDSYSLHLPHNEFIGHLRLKWSFNGADYLDEAGALAAFDPNAHDNGPTALLLRKDLLEEYLIERGLTLCWVILGEKQVVGGDASMKFHGRLKVSGAYRYTENRPVGFLNCNADIPEENADSSLEEQGEAVDDGDAQLI